MRATISLVPIDSAPTDLLSWLAERLEPVFSRSVTVNEPIPLPAGGYDSRRRQY